MAYQHAVSNKQPAECGVGKRHYQRRGKAPLMSLDQPGRLWFANLMHLFGISHQTLYVRLRSGDYPKADGIDGGRQYWKTSTIRDFLEK